MTATEIEEHETPETPNLKPLVGKKQLIAKTGNVFSRK